MEEFAVPPHDNVMARLALLREEQAKLRQVFCVFFTQRGVLVFVVEAANWD